MIFKNIFKHEGHTVYQIDEKVVIIQKTKNKIYFWNKKIGFIKSNFKFIFRPSFWLVRFPFFFFERNNGGISIGTPNLYLWLIS